MELTKKQKEALSLAVERYVNGEPYTCISGYAGSGKTTLVQFIIKALNLSESEVCYIAYTGKAALVLKEKGCLNAMTAHRLLYHSFRNKDGTYRHIPVLTHEMPHYKLIVVDEVSMMPKTLWDLLLSHNMPVLALGDPGQLPPMGEDNGILNKAHIFLDEIVRQAQESEIIKLSMEIRSGKSLIPFKGKQVQIIGRSELTDGMLLWADQIICAKNTTRKQINNRVRELIFNTKDPKPVEGDKVICLQNQWDTISEYGDTLVNGTVGEVSYIRYRDTKKLHPQLLIDLLPEGTQPSACDADPYFRNLSIDAQLLIEGEPTINNQNFKTFSKMEKPVEFDYGYAITCWKAQGSEYGKVLLFEEDFPRNAEEKIKYLYTGITRAKDKLVIIRKD